MLFRPLLSEIVLLAEMAPAAADPAHLHPEEQAHIARAVEKRRREFAAGRLLARGLLTEAGAGVDCLLPDGDRVPRWPEGVVGSITHCDRICAAAVAPASATAGVGLDVEPAVALADGLVPMIVRPEEHARLASLPSGLQPLAGILTFSIKEAVYKAIYPRQRVFLDFQQVAIDFEGEDGFVADVLVDGAAPPGFERVRGRFRLVDSGLGAGCVAAAVLLPPPR